MPKHKDLPSRRSSGVARAVDVKGWLGGVRLSVFMTIMLFLVVFGVLVLVPTVSTYVGQKQRITALEQQVQVGQDRVDTLTAERDAWRDPAYVLTQARERLYYYRPGELNYIVVDDLDPTALPAEQKSVSKDVTQTPSDWMNRMLRSVTEAGLAQGVTTDPAAPVPTPTGTPAP